MGRGQFSERGAHACSACKRVRARTRRGVAVPLEHMNLTTGSEGVQMHDTDACRQEEREREQGMPHRCLWVRRCEQAS